MLYWTAVTIGLFIGGIDAYFYVKSVHERHRLGLSTPYSRSIDAKAFSDVSEHRVYEALKDTFDAMCGPDAYYLSKGPLILTHARGRPVPTCEIDHLIVCSFGIFVIETKGWNGLVSPGGSADSVKVEFRDGNVVSRRSPIAQCASKVAFIKRCQPSNWRVEPLAIFAHPDARLATTLPSDMICVENIGRYFQAKRKETMSGECGYVDVQLALGATLAHRDRRPNACDLHLEAIRRAAVH